MFKFLLFILKIIMLIILIIISTILDLIWLWLKYTFDVIIKLERKEKIFLLMVFLFCVDNPITIYILDSPLYDYINNYIEDLFFRIFGYDLYDTPVYYYNEIPNDENRYDNLVYIEIEDLNLDI